MSVILGKYKNKRKLGKGAYGDVLLVQDQNGKEIALKMISKKMLQKEQFLQQYLEGEKQVMMSVKNRYVMELFAYQEDENYKYFVCEFCDGGDLLNYQAKQPNKVFDLKTATKLLSEVIQGLQVLHSKGYLHRDIKPQNILLKKQPNKTGYVCKLADFGFAKKCDKAEGTVLGTENFMSPEIYSNEKYSYEVDMWAFGVVFYFMLNMEFPFRVNPHSELEQKRKDLIKQATNFNYAQNIKKGKKGLVQNCTDQVNDIFSKIFTTNPQQRITFVDIRAHPLFKQYFPVIENESKILYKKKKDKLDRYNSFIETRMSVIVKKPINPPKRSSKIAESDNAPPEPSFPKLKTVQEKAQLDAELDRILFLDEMADSLRVLYGEMLTEPQLESFRYDLLRYQIILLRNLKASLNIQALSEKYPKLKWKQFSKTKQFAEFLQSVKENIDKAELNFSQSQYQCENVMSAIKMKNPEFEKAFEAQVMTKQFSGPFKKSYRGSTTRIYEIVREKLSKGNNYSYLTALIVLCHAFNQLMNCIEEELSDLFSGYIQARKTKGKPVEFRDLKIWMSTSSKQQIQLIIKKVLEAFFG